jgi:hypothetical protein
LSIPSGLWRPIVWDSWRFPRLHLIWLIIWRIDDLLDVGIGVVKSAMWWCPLLEEAIAITYSARSTALATVWKLWKLTEMPLRLCSEILRGGSPQSPLRIPFPCIQRHHGFQ